MKMKIDIQNKSFLSFLAVIFCSIMFTNSMLLTVTMAEVNKEEIVWENGVETEDGIIWGDLIYKIRYNNTERVMITGIKPGVSDVVIPEMIDNKKVTHLSLGGEYFDVKSITIPKSVTSMQQNLVGTHFTYDGFRELEKIEVDPANKKYGDIKGVILYNKRTSTLLEIPTNYQGKRLVIPKCIKIIRRQAVTGYPNLKTVILGKNVKRIEVGAFAFCKNLKKVKFHKRLKRIESEAFSDCDSLKKVVVPQKTKIAESAFPKKCRIIRK